MSKTPEFTRISTEPEATEAMELLANLAMPGREQESLAVVAQLLLYTVRETIGAVAGDLKQLPASDFKGKPENVRRDLVGIVTAWSLKI